VDPDPAKGTVGGRVGAEHALAGELEHSVLGTRYVYDGLLDDRYVLVLAGVALTGQGQALGMAVHDGRWYVAPTAVTLQGGGWGERPAAVDEFKIVADDMPNVVLHNDRFELIVHRHPVVEPIPAIGLSATVEGQPETVVLAGIHQRNDRLV
jgi:hypothetical protein